MWLLVIVLFIISNDGTPTEGANGKGYGVSAFSALQGGEDVSYPIKTIYSQEKNSHMTAAIGALMLCEAAVG